MSVSRSGENQVSPSRAKKAIITRFLESVVYASSMKNWCFGFCRDIDLIAKH